MSNFDSAVIIPSLEPGKILVPYVKSILDAGFLVVVVDDGSGEAYQSIFDEIALLDGATVLHHKVNRGKGCALKTAYRHIMDKLPAASRIMTADADGQHTLLDIIKLDKALKDGAEGLILGSRNFALSHVPFKSRAGNRITTAVFWLLYGVWCPDTQTGLRACNKDLLPVLEAVQGERFEYEMQVLIALSREKIKLTPVTIETVYENENEGSHFHPVRDSIRIYKVILGNFFKFIFSSLITTGIDMAVYYVLFDVFENAALSPAGVYVSLAKVIARVLSASVNFLVNKKFVFRLEQGGRRVALRYACLCVAVLALSVGSVLVMKYGLNINERISSPIVDTVLFFLSYRVQRNWVFREDKE